MVDGGASAGEKLFGGLVQLQGLRGRAGRLLVLRGQAVDLLGVEHGVGYLKIERVKDEGFALLSFPCPRLRLRAAPVRTKALDPLKAVESLFQPLEMNSLPEYSTSATYLEGNHSMSKIFLSVITAALLFLSSGSAWAAVSIPFTVNLSENVVVNTGGGTPRIPVDVGGVTRYATYTSGSGTAALTFTYDAVLGDVDLDGVTLSSPVQLNGGTMKDAAGNDAALTFTAPNTSGVKVNYPSLGMDFTNGTTGRYTLNGTVYTSLASFLAASSGTFSRASVGTYYDSIGTLQTASSGTPRFDYDPVTHAAKGILIEEQRTNILTYSDQINNAAWTKSGLGVAINSIIAPDGTLSADKITPDASNTFHYFKQNYAFGSATYTASIYMKMAENRYGVVSFNNTGVGVFDLQTGTVVSGSGALMTSVGNGWYRCTMTVTTYGTATQIEFSGLSTPSWTAFTGDTTSGIYVWGAQLESGAFPTSYIPTTTAAVPRAGDALFMPTTGWYNQSEGAFFAHTQSPIATGSTNNGSSIYTTTNASLNAGVYLRYRALANNYTQSMSIPPSLSNTISSDVGTTTSGNNKTAQAIKDNDYSFYANGILVNSDNTCTLTTGITQLYLSGAQPNLLSARGNTSYKTFKYYPARVSDTQLQLLTQ